MGCNPLHSDQTVSDGIHIPYAFEYYDSSDREDAYGFSGNDIGKFARQLDDNSVWMLVDDSPTIWVRISGEETTDINEIRKAIQTILKDLDGYHPDITGQEHYRQLSGAIQTVIKSLDGYSSGGLSEVTFNQNKKFWNDSIYYLNRAADGYHPDITGTQHYKQLSDAIIDVRKALDGYSGSSPGGDCCEELSEAIQTILKDLDGYIDGYDTAGYHRDLDELVHNIAETSYEEMTYDNGKVSNITIYADAGKTKKIREEQYVYDPAKISTITTIQYDYNGVEVERVVETYTWNGNNVTSISRVLTLS